MGVSVGAGTSAGAAAVGAATTVGAAAVWQAAKRMEAISSEESNLEKRTAEVMFVTPFRK
jgi:hypothetical protein